MEKIECLIQLTNLENLNAKESFSKEERDALDLFFNKYVKNGEVYTELLAKVGKEKYESLSGFVKGINKDYFEFNKVLQTNGPDLIDIFNSCFVYLDDKSFEKYQKKYSKGSVIGVLNIFGRISDFCIVHNYANTTFKSLLEEYYDCPNELAESISNAFGEQRDHLILLKLLRQQSSKR